MLKRVKPFIQFFWGTTFEAKARASPWDSAGILDFTLVDSKGPHAHGRSLQALSSPLHNLCRPVSEFLEFLGTVPGSLKKHLNTEELFHITLTALVAGGGMFGLLQMSLNSVGTIFPAPTDAALAGTILTMILEVIRRLRHGTDLKTNDLNRDFHS